jgi:hypothetical protein
LKSIQQIEGSPRDKAGFHINRFKVTLDFDAWRALIDDDLTLWTKVNTRCGLADFARSLKNVAAAVPSDPVFPLNPD